MNQDLQNSENSVAAHAVNSLSSDALKAVKQGPIGVFDSGYGGLTILNGIRQLLPQYDYLYLGDNARAPYGPRSYEVVYEFTRQAVKKLFDMGCQLVILGCNTASAKALRSIQQNDLAQWDSSRRVLGVIRPTAEIIGKLTTNGHVGLLATEGTVKSNSYTLEIAKLWPNLTVTGQACPFWWHLLNITKPIRPVPTTLLRSVLINLCNTTPKLIPLSLAVHTFHCSCQRF